MTDPRCGSEAGYQVHYKAGTPACRPCLDGHAKSLRDYRAQLYLAGGQLMVDATGTRRRLQALSCLGWTFETVADDFGVSRTSVQQWAANPRVYRRTAARIARFYALHSDTAGPSPRAAARARTAGWVPPIAWDDDSIDDPAAQPYAGESASLDEVAVHRAMRGDHRVKLTRPERLQAVRLLTERGYSSAEIADLLGKHQRAIVRDRAEASA